MTMTMETSMRGGNLEIAQNEALGRLVALLEAFGPETVGLPLLAAVASDNRMARLRLARAHYALHTNGEMERAGAGAWLLHRSAA